MITFNNSLEAAVKSVCLWSKKSFLSEVTIIRDVYGKLSFLMDNAQPIPDSGRQEIASIFHQELGPYFSGKLYWKKSSSKIQKREKLIIDILEQERRIWINRDHIEFYLSERPIAKKAWVCQPADQESVWTYDEAAGDNGKKVITFYSFKGGMGRTTALAAVALNLIKQRKNVMMVDTDIEAPGLATLFFDEELIARGVLDYLIEHEIDDRVSLADYVLDVTDPVLLDENDGQLFLMPAGKVDDNYLQKLSRIDFQDNRAGYLRDALAALLTDIKANYDVDYILIDARAGFHDMGGVAVAQLPHGVVLFGNDSRQSWDGLTQVLRTIAVGHRADFPVMIVGAMCPKASSEGYTLAKEHFIDKSYTVCVDNYYDEGSEIPGVKAEGEIHFPELLSFNYELLQGVELYSDGSQKKNQRVNAYKTILTGEDYKKIANRIISWFGED